MSELEASKTTDGQAEDEAYMEGMRDGFNAGFDRCLDLVEWACEQAKILPSRIQQIKGLLENGPPKGRRWADLLLAELARTEKAGEEST